MATKISSKIRVFIVDDDEAISQFLTVLLEGEGYQVQRVSSGEDAIASWRAFKPDLIIMDVTLPGILGYEATEKILAEAGEPKIPVLFITGLADDDVIRKCYASGGDDFFTKPINQAEFIARVSKAISINAKYKAEYKQRQELVYHREMIEREQEIAKSLFTSLMSREQLNMSNVRYHASSMSIFNGDMILMSCMPDGRMNIMVGDFTGHGLSASIGTLPASEIFYAMTAKGFGISEIVTEINRRLIGLLPVDMFLVARGVEIDAGTTSAKVWGGGMPDMIIRRSKGSGIERIASQHLPIGVMSVEEFDATTIVVDLQDGDKIYLFTDGMTEAENASGEMFGMNALVKQIKDVANDEDVYDDLFAALDDFTAGHEQTDDLTLLEYTCVREQDRVNLQKPVSKGDLNPLTSSGLDWELRINMETEALGSLEIEPIVTQIIMDIQGLYDDRDILFRIFAELYTNALEYGVLGMNPEMKSELGSAAFHQEKMERLQDLKSGFIVISVQHHPRRDGGLLRIQVEDSGKGFDFKSWEASADPRSGIRILKDLCEEVRYYPPGNEVHVTYRWAVSS